MVHKLHALNGPFRDIFKPRPDRATGTTAAVGFAATSSAPMRRAATAARCLVLCLSVLAAAAAAAPAPGDDGYDTWRYPSMPRAIRERKTEPPASGAAPAPPRQAAPPPGASAYAHRQGQLSLRVPAGTQGLKLQLREHEGFVLGTAFSPDTVTGIEDRLWYTSKVMTLFTGLTPENRFKWPLFERTQGQTNESQAVLDEEYMGFAEQAGVSLLRGHTLDWFKVGPFWAHQLSCDAYVAALKERVTRDVSRNKYRFQHYDVWNEVIESPGMLDKCNLWDTAFPDAFKWAHAADPTAKLCINDLSLIEGHNAPRLIEIITKHVWAHGAPIHCIGIQAHFEQWGVNATFQREKLDLLATLGLELYISEFSLFSTWNGPGGRPISYLDEATQAATTIELLRLYFSHPAVKGFFLWGFWDGQMWIPNAGLYAADKQAKQAARDFERVWGQEMRTRLQLDSLVSPAATISGDVKFKGFFGTYEYELLGPDGRWEGGDVRFTKARPSASLVVVRGAAPPRQ